MYLRSVRGGWGCPQLNTNLTSLTAFPNLDLPSNKFTQLDKPHPDPHSAQNQCVPAQKRKARTESTKKANFHYPTQVAKSPHPSYPPHSTKPILIPSKSTLYTPYNLPLSSNLILHHSTTNTHIQYHLTTTVCTLLCTTIRMLDSAVHTIPHTSTFPCVSLKERKKFGSFSLPPPGVYRIVTKRNPYLRPYRDEHTASRPIRAVKHRRGQRVLPWVTRREHCAAAGLLVLRTTFLLRYTVDPFKQSVPAGKTGKTPSTFNLLLWCSFARGGFMYMPIRLHGCT